MSATDDYLAELGAQLRTRGPARRRFLEECRDHLEQADGDSEEAIARFGSAASSAAELDAESAVRVGRVAAVASLVGVVAVGVSTLVLVNAGQQDVRAPVFWAVVFFGAAQASAAAAGLVALQLAASWRGLGGPAHVALLCRRCLVGLLCATVTLFAAGAAVSGEASALVLLTGPVLALVAGLLVWRTRRLLRVSRGDERPATASPLEDLRRLVGVRLRWLSPSRLVLLVGFVVTVGAYVWGRGERDSVAGAASVAAVELALYAAGFALLGTRLGLRTDTSR